MHASASAAIVSSRSVASSSQPRASELPSGTTPVPYAVDATPCPTAASSPQCCHCGWRGAHAPTCPFK
ncbi:hypothetical protein K466DRAFT_485883 [Polyporus arcularius HHB13444]|uniref:Uncharacterized protein n=1 Tax=Polyporus arcularius HHB13444 TaxID=1314778 RepID=A0A5C3PNK3_9APHY|nr:hypothetical protein K466DRAFT_485883 [Polyporus arcularius HHB13444]